MRVLIAGWPMSGHVIPLAAVCRELVRRGHEVQVVGDDGMASWHGAFRAPVVELASPRIDEEPDFVAFQAAQADRSPFERGAAAADMFVRKSIERVPLVDDQVERFAPDVILRDYMFHAAWMVGARREIPVATFAYFPLSPAQFAELFPDAFERAFTETGLRDDVSLLDRWLTIHGMPRSWVGDQPLPPTSHLVQPADLPGEDADVDELLRGLDDRPLVYATLGTAFTDDPDLWSMVFDGVAPLDVNVVATLGASADPSTVAAPANARLVRFVPQTALLPHCRAVIGHGGYGTIMGALRAGLPLVSIPVGASDNMLNARRVRDIGVGVALTSRDRSAADVERALHAVLDEHNPYRTAAQEVAREIAELPPAEHAATLLEELV